MSWTDERITLLKKLWAEGRTAAEIARAMGSEITRNAVIGKAHRLKLAARNSPISGAIAKSAPKAKKPANTQKTDRPVTRIGPRGSNNVPSLESIEIKGVKMIDLKERMCRFPIGDPGSPDFKFCGCTAVPGLPYCDGHSRIAYQMNKRSKLVSFQESTTEEADEESIKAAFR